MTAFKKALQIDTANLGIDHRIVRTRTNHLALTLQETGLSDLPKPCTGKMLPLSPVMRPTRPNWHQPSTTWRTSSSISAKSRRPATCSRKRSRSMRIPTAQTTPGWDGTWQIDASHCSVNVDWTSRQSPLHVWCWTSIRQPMGLTTPRLGRTPSIWACCYTPRGMGTKLGPNHPRTALAMHHHGVYGPTHPQVATDLHNLAIAVATRARHHHRDTRGGSRERQDDTGPAGRVEQLNRLSSTCTASL